MWNFYPRSPRGERLEHWEYNPNTLLFLSTLPARGATIAGYFKYRRFGLFLSTLPARGATQPPQRPAPRSYDFYPRSPRGERPHRVDRQLTVKAISIHAPREGSDCYHIGSVPNQRKFLSTLPARGATRQRTTSGTPSRFLSTLPARGATAKMHKGIFDFLYKIMNLHIHPKGLPF